MILNLTVFDENNKRIYTSKNNSDTKAEIAKLKNNRYAGIKLDRLLASF